MLLIAQLKEEEKKGGVNAILRIPNIKYEIAKIDKHYLDSFESNDRKPFWLLVIIQNGVNLDSNLMEIINKYSFSLEIHSFS